ncbi:single-stranded DNA-binding protein [Caloranaerobacter ferrireducens]|uniref:single-stranded DNA-binding protein n=1 Tax=Caloranaerobacter ferrireducens TaxID=1323370 RepID=UPI00084D1FB6|nr:single-stranded DNA-binding protein [Caloranaerobacter ferrireducens]
MNTWFGIGRLTKDVELRYTPNGKAIATGTIAISRRYNQEKTDFIDIRVWGASAEKYFAEYGKKGRLIAVQGELNIDTWKDENGNWQSRTYITASNVRFLDNRKDNDIPEGFQSVDDDSIPF